MIVSGDSSIRNINNLINQHYTHYFKCIKRDRSLETNSRGKMAAKSSHSLKEVLTEEQISQIAEQSWAGCEVVNSEVRPAGDGLPGYNGDYMKAVLILKQVKNKEAKTASDEQLKKLHLFIKRIPLENKPKADFIDENDLYRREMLMYQLRDEMSMEGECQWSVKAYLCTPQLLVLPDLSVEGYRSHTLFQPMDSSHVHLVTSSLARFHAAVADHNNTHDLYSKNYKILQETLFNDTPFVRTAAKLAADFLDAFSSNYNKKIPNFELKLAKSFLDACSSLRHDDTTLNVLLHRDLWSNNILFKYEQGVPVNAILVDFQCLRYGPPAFDLMCFLYMSTSRDFRKEYESDIAKHYLQVFFGSIGDETRKRLDVLGYNEEQFAFWCERSRMFGMIMAGSICPLALIDPMFAEKHFANPDTYNSLLNVDRSPLIVEYARNDPQYKQRVLEFFEEYAERYII